VNIPVATALGRRERFWPAASLSVAVHASLVIWAIARTPAPLDLDQKPLHARLVRLGEKKPEDFLPRREEPPTPPPAPAEPVPPPPVPPPEVVAAPPAPAPVPAATPKPAPAARKAPAAAGKADPSNALASALSRVRKEVAAEKQWGDPEGDASGDSETGEGDRYYALVERALRSSYDVPSTISDKERLYLKATLLLYIEPDGRIARWRFEQHSGNSAFDAALERTLRATRLPPPPDAERDFYRRTGLHVLFKI
jgi:colicin import membrane protein/protein TonB